MPIVNRSAISSPSLPLLPTLPRSLLLPPTPLFSLSNHQVDKAQQDKQSAIIRAQGEAQSATLIGQAIKDNPSFITLRWV